VLTWPQALHLGTQTARHEDPLFSIWRLSWVAHALSSGDANLFDGNIFYPHRRTLAYSDAMLLQSVVAAPFLWAQVNPVLVYNLLLLAGIVCSGLGMFVLARYLTNDEDTALVSAAVFTLVPYRVEHFMHLELQWTIWMPLTLWALHRAHSEGSLRFGALAGVLLWLQMVSSVYYGAFLGMIAAAFALLLTASRRRPAGSAVRPFGLAAVLAIVLTAPYAIPYVDSSRAVGLRQSGDVGMFSARLSSYFSAPEQNWLWGWTARDYPGNELHLFPGLAAIALAVVGLIKGPRRTASIYLAILAGAVTFSFGTRGPVYAWMYEWVRPLQGFRAPARFAILACCALAVLAGFGFQSLRRRLSGAAHRSLLGAVLVVLAVEYGSAPMILGQVPTAVPELYRQLRTTPNAPLIEFPFDFSVDYMYWSIHHWRPLVNGYSGYTPPDYIETRKLMATFPDDASIARLRTLGVRHIVVHQAFYKEKDWTALMLQLMRRPELKPAGRFRDWVASAQVFELRPAS
jgi:hypothetical protein